MPQESASELMTFEETGYTLKVKKSTLRKWAAERRMPIVRIGRRAVRIPAQGVREQIKNGYRPAVTQEFN